MDAYFVQSLVRLYAMGASRLTCGIRKIIDAKRNEGLDVDAIIVSGGAAQSVLVHQLQADAANNRDTVLHAAEPDLLGSVMSGAVTGGAYHDLAAALAVMSAKV